MSDIKPGDKVWHCYFYAHNISQFQIKKSVVDKINNCQYDSSPWAYDSEGELIGRLNKLSLSECGAIKNLRVLLENKQDSLRDQYKEECDRLHKLMEENRSYWLGRDSDINNKIGYLRSKEAQDVSS